MLYIQTDLRYRLVDKEKEHICILTSCAKIFKYQSISYVNIFNFFEIQNIHPESKGNFHIKLSVKPF